MADGPRDDQQKIDFSRASQLAALRDADLTFRRTRHGNGVSPLVQKAVLRVIDDHGRGRTCFISYQTIAKESGLGLRQAKRAVEVLLDAGLLIVETKMTPYGTVCNHYTIVWSDLDLLTRDNRLPLLAPPASDRSDLGVTPRAGDQSDLRSDQSDLRSDQSDLGVTQTASKRSEALGTATSPCPSVAQWAEAEDFLRRKGIARANEIAALWESRARQPDELVAAATDALATAALSPNAKLLTRPMGAVAWLLERGVWPCEGVVSCQEYAATELKRLAAVAAKAAAEEESQNALALERQAMEEREQRYGSVVAQLDEEGAAALLPYLVGAHRDYVAKQKRPWSPLTRVLLLAAVEKRAREAAT